MSKMKKTLMLTLLLMIWVVWGGYILMWIIMPTEIYRKKWRLSIRSVTTSTYFGTTQGSAFLTFTFPVIFVAVAGSIYLHLGKLQESSTSGNRGEDVQKDIRIRRLIRSWRRPVVVKGPLGILSGIELSFFLLFIALLLWSFIYPLSITFSTINPKKLDSYGGSLWMARLASAGLRLGVVGNIALAFIFFPVTRGSTILPIFGLTSEMAIKYHIWLAHILMSIFTAHGLSYVIVWTANSQTHQMLVWAKTGVSNVAGELALLAGLGLWATTFPRIRRKMFEVFFYSHHLYVLFIIFFILHVGISFASRMLPGFYLFMIDRYLRFLQSQKNVRLLFARVLPSQALELNFSKSHSLSYTPTSIIFINVPIISKLQWHPFTVTSSSSLEPEKLSVLIKVEGNWTRKLHEMLASAAPDCLQVSVEGPYGPNSTHFLGHDMLVMISGGSGITPFFSIIRELLHQSATLCCKIPKLLLICAFKNSSDLTMLELLLPVSNTLLNLNLSNIQLQINAYVTQEKEPPNEQDRREHNNIQRVWFKPKETDSSIIHILGQNGYIWLGVIVSSSFIGFLLFVGIMTRYLIYPKDHNTNDIFPLSARSGIQMLILCVCIAATSSGVMFWSKRKTAMETSHVVNMEGTTPTTSHDSWFDGVDTELGSLPSHTLSQFTKVQYGERPNLRNLLFDCEGTSIGVLVCGPKKMRHEVAAVCASGLTDNLHFESINFSW